MNQIRRRSSSILYAIYIYSQILNEFFGNLPDIFSDIIRDPIYSENGGVANAEDGDKTYIRSMYKSMALS